VSFRDYIILGLEAVFCCFVLYYIIEETLEFGLENYLYIRNRVV
jgi:hypothetical protein